MKKVMMVITFLMNTAAATPPWLSIEIQRGLVPAGRTQTVHATCSSKKDRACSLWLERDGAKISQGQASYRALASAIESVLSMPAQETPKEISKRPFVWTIEGAERRSGGASLPLVDAASTSAETTRSVMKLETVLLYRLRFK